MDQRLSEKIDILRFLLVGLVVFVHGNGILPALTISPSFFTKFIINIPMFSLGKLAVPMLFLISGYLFFISYRTDNKPSVAKIISRRLKKIVFPYLLWNLIAIFWFYKIHAVRFDKLTESYDYLNLFFYYLEDVCPIYYPFWYIRDLLYLFIISPIILWFSSTRFPYALPIIAFISIILCSYREASVYINLWRFSIGLLYFTIGALCALKQYPIDVKKPRYIPYFFILYLLICIPIWHFEKKGIFIKSIDAATSLWGIYLLWIGFDCIPTILKNILDRMTSYTFILYATHALWIGTLTYWSGHIFKPNNQIEILVDYFLIILLTIIVSILLAILIRKVSPRFYALSTGNR